MKLLCGDARVMLASLPEKACHVAITSPPYWGLRAYKTEPQEWADGWRGELGSEPSPEMFVAHLVEVFRAVRRVLRDDGTLWVNLNNSYFGANWRGSEAIGTKQATNRGANASQHEFNPQQWRGMEHAVLKPLDLVDVCAMFSQAMVRDGWYHRSTITWCLSHSTRVYAQTQKGDIPMTVGEMVRLRPETVKLWTGEKWVQVTAFTRSVSQDSIEIMLRTRQHISSTPEHLWPTERGILPTSELRIGDKLLSVRLPEPESPIEPTGIPARFGFIIGYYLAEGNAGRHGRLIFSMNAQETVETDKLREFAAFYGSSCTVRQQGNSQIVCIDGGAASSIIHTYVWGKDAKHKHLTTAAWQRSNVFIDAVLKGYLQGDAHYDTKNDRWRLGFARNDILAEDLRTLCARLGYSARLYRFWHKNQTGQFYGWKGEIRLHPDVRKSCDTEVIGIQRSKSERFWDISIEEPHVFALASGILTHNCKEAPMPESVSGWRWERHRVRSGEKRSSEIGVPTGWDTAHQSDPKQGRYENDNLVGKMIDCLGCARCLPNDGLILRKGSWRPTNAYELIFMFAKTDSYYASGEDVRLPLAESSIPRAMRGVSEQNKWTDGAPGSTAHTMARPRPNIKYVEGDYGGAGSSFTNGHSGVYAADGRLLINPAGANMRNWVTLKRTNLSEKHYASFPISLPAMCIKIGTSARGVCSACGSPYVRVIEHTQGRVWEGRPKAQGQGGYGSQTSTLSPSGSSEGWAEYGGKTQTLGWRQSCSCKDAGEPVRATILDPFVGSGTTLLAAAGLGRDGIGIDLSPEYISMSKRRLGLLAGDDA